MLSEPECGKGVKYARRTEFSQEEQQDNLLGDAEGKRETEHRHGRERRRERGREAGKERRHEHEIAHGGAHGHAHGFGHAHGVKHRFGATYGLDAKTLTGEDRLLALFYGCAHQLHHRKGNPRAQGQSRILAILAQHESLTQRELLDIAGIRSASLSELLGKVESSGYITREKNAADHRNIDIRLTEAGKQAARGLPDQRATMAQELFFALDTSEREQLADILEKLLTSWE
ncbi:MAG: MarR family transcriptional regulator [Coriobacteriales bacterium]|nr:MarR family transcriptional regulator [Coriobacteriales bacterium]